MQTSLGFSIDIYNKISEISLNKFIFHLSGGDRIFLYGDLGTGKSTFTRVLLRSYFQDKSLIIRSPTYTYYQKYGNNVYHFDLYRVDNFDDLYLLGILEILENPDNICIIEWPEILGNFINPTKKVTFVIEEEETRTITIET